MARPGGSKNNSLKQPNQEINVKYMHRPPLITPNYGNQKRSLLPKSKVSRVLLYDNATQDHMLDIKLANINIEKDRICRLINLHQRAFSLRMTKRQHNMQMHASTAGSRSKNVKPSGKYDSVRERSTLRPTSLPVTMNTVANSAATKIQDNQAASFVKSIKLPALETEQRHVIFKVKSRSGKTEVYHTIDEHGFLSDLIPMHTFYPKLTDDPRFRSLQKSLVPSDNENSHNSM